MNGEDTDRTSETQETVVTRNTYIDTARGIWRDFGPLLIGLLVLIVVLAGGWYLWRNRIQPSGNNVAPDGSEEEISFNNIPEAELSLGPTPSPTPVSSPRPSPSASPSATTSPRAVAQSKGGQLPQTGIPAIIPVVFTLSALGGLALRKFAK